MDKYYYFVAQLPMLFYGKESDITSEHFLDEAKKWLSNKDYNILSRISVDDFDVKAKSNKVLTAFKIYESNIRTDIAMWRKAKKIDQDYKPSTFAPSIIKEGNPLEIEKKLLELRWAFLDEMEREHNFDLGFLILYYLKLQILKRLFTFNKEKGLNKFQKFYEVSI